MNTSDIISLLGKPDRKSKNGLIWIYDIYYSLYINIKFDKKQNINKIESCLPNKNIKDVEN